MPRYIYIDAGCNSGDTLELFCQKKIFPNANPTIHEIYLFDVNKNFEENISIIGQKYKIAPNFIPKAVWTTNGTINCNFSKDKSISSSIIDQHNKSIIYYHDYITSVECIDFSQWILTNFQSNDQILLKMDIEGAEFEVLQKMIRDRSIFYIKELHIEYHTSFKFFSGKVTRQWYRDLRNTLTSYMTYYGIKVTTYK